MTMTKAQLIEALSNVDDDEGIYILHDGVMCDVDETGFIYNKQVIYAVQYDHEEEDG